MNERKTFWDKNAGCYDRFMRKDRAAYEEMVELGITAHISLINTKQMVPNRRIENYGSFIVLTSSMHIANARQLFVKRLMDIAGGIVGLALTAIAFVIFAPIIKIQSPGPVFFKQVRIGKNGRRFNFYKFRS